MFKTPKNKKTVTELKKTIQKYHAVLMHDTWWKPEKEIYCFETENLNAFRLNKKKPNATVDDMKDYKSHWIYVSKEKSPTGFRYRTQYTTKYDVVEAKGNHKALYEFMEKLFKKSGEEVKTNTGSYVMSAPDAKKTTPKKKI